MNLKPNQHKKISFNTTTMTSLGFIGPPQNLRSPLKFSFPPNLIFCSGPPQLFWSEIFRSPPKIGRGGGGGLLPWTCKMESFAEMVNGFEPLNVLAKSSVLNFWQGSEYPSASSVDFALSLPTGKITKKWSRNSNNLLDHERSNHLVKMLLSTHVMAGWGLQVLS